MASSEYTIRIYPHSDRWSILHALEEVLPANQQQTPDERLRHGEVCVLVRITPPEPRAVP